MKKTIIVLFLGIITALSLSFFHKTDPSLTVCYSLNYKGDSWQKQRTGFLWALSYLGAELPKGSFDRAIEWKDSSSFKIDFGKLGFDGYALNALTAITDSIKETAYYKKYNRIDLGQFIALTIGSSWHYYAITNTPATYRKFLSARGLKDPAVFLLSKSTVAKHHRVIKYSINPSILKTTFIAEEGEGILGNNFSPAFFETIDVMKNGQLHFAVYNSEGNLVSASPLELGSAGKPAKCMWCHEIVFQPLFTKADPVKNSISPEEFQQLMETQNAALNVYRETLNSDIDFNNRQDHTQMELLYISYKEPGVDKIAKEWGLKDEEVNLLLKKTKTHQHDEFKFLTHLVYRDSLSEFFTTPDIKVPESIREPCGNEICYTGNKKESTGTLHPSIPDATIQLHQPASLNGCFFMSPYKNNAKSAAGLLNKVMILNAKGEVICFRETGIGNDFKQQANGLITFWNGSRWLLADRHLNVIDSVSCVNDIQTDNHDFLILPGGHYLLIGKQREVQDLSQKNYFNQGGVTNGSKKAVVKYDVIQELDEHKQLVFQWNSKDHFKMEDADRFYLTDTATVDVTHFNSIDVDAEGNILVSARFFNEVFKINKKTGAIMWRLGGKYNTLTLLHNPKPFLGQHDARFTGQNTFTLFDNGHTYDSLKQHARTLEYEINETLKTAKVTGEYANSFNIYSQAAGNVQKTKNGYTLVNYGKTKQGGQNVTLEMLDSKNNKVLSLFYADTMASYRAYYYETCPVFNEQPELKLIKKNGSTYITPVNPYRYCLWNTGQTEKEIEFVAGKMYYAFLSNDNTVYIRSKSRQAKP